MLRLIISDDTFATCCTIAKAGEYTIAEITDMVGFSDAKYFREVFKKYYGVSPSKYGESEKTGSYPAINLKNEK